MNRSRHLHALRALALMGVLVVASPQASQARDPEASPASLTMEIAAMQDPTSVHALILGGEEVATRPVQVARKDSETLKIIVPRAPTDTTEQRFVALEMRDAESATGSWSRVTSLDAHRTNPSRVALCAPTKVDVNAMAEQRATLERLLEVRRKLQETYRAQLQGALSGQLLERVQNLESHLGLESPEQLSGDLPAREIHARLARVLAAARAIKMQSTKAK